MEKKCVPRETQINSKRITKKTQKGWETNRRGLQKRSLPARSSFYFNAKSLSTSEEKEEIFRII